MFVMVTIAGGSGRYPPKVHPTQRFTSKIAMLYSYQRTMSTGPENSTDTADTSDIAERFLANPASFQLFRAENATNVGGLHFALNKEWVKNFGTEIYAGFLPAGSRIKLLAEVDMEEAFEQGLVSEQALWDSIFNEGYDAILGHDAMNSKMLDIIVNPKLLHRFEVLSSTRNYGKI